MKDNFPAALAFTLAYEGGWSDHPSDPGGATMRGITLATYSGWLGRPASKAELRAIPPGHVDAIYRKNYWNAVRADILPSGYDACMFDYAVNSGPARALQHDKALPLNLSTIARVKALCARRMAFVRGLRTWATFGKGWTRRIAALEAFCLRRAGMTPAGLQAEAKAADQAAVRNAGAASAGAVAAPATVSASGWLLAVIAVVTLAGLGLLAFKAWQQHERAKALRAEAGVA